MPPGDPAEPRQPPRIPGAVMRKRMRKRMEAEHARMLGQMKDQGMDTSKVPPLPPEPEEQPPDMDDLGEYVEEKQAMAERMKVEAEAAKTKALEQARAECAKHGIDFDKLVEEEKAKRGGPPKFSARDQMETLRGLSTMASNAGTEIPQVTAMLANPELEKKLTQAEAKLRESYRKFAHHFPPARRLEGEDAARVRAEVARAAAARESMAGRDFTGADLAGHEPGWRRSPRCAAGARQPRWRGARRGRSLGRRARARGPHERQPVRREARRDEPRRRDARRGGARRGRPDEGDAREGRPDARQAARAKLDGADFLEATLRGSDWSGATCPKAKLIKLDLGA